MKAGRSFGYKINNDRQICYDENDHTFINIIRSLEPTIDICIGCGSCTATCSAGNFTPFSIRRVHTFLTRSETDGLRKELEKCMFCGKCQLVCPRGVNLRNLILMMLDQLPFQNNQISK